MLSAAAPPIPFDTPFETPLDPLSHSTLPTSTFSRPDILRPNVEPHLLEPESVEIDMTDPADPRLQLHGLPIEIQEAILDHLFGVRNAALGSITAETPTASTWSKSLRHPRRKVLSNLAMVSSSWRPLVQERIYRHSQY